VLTIKTTSEKVNLNINEECERIMFAEELRDYGWFVLEEVWVVKMGTYYRADIVASHPEYDKLGWFLFELKVPKGGFRDIVTKAHKQIVYRYVGSRINDFRYPNLRESPSVFIYRIPCSQKSSWIDREWWTTIRFFNRYGIGLLFSDKKEVIFHPNNPSWARLHLDPQKNEKYLDLYRLKKYLEARIVGLE